MPAKYWLTLTIALGGTLAVTAAEAAKKKSASPPPVAVGCTQPIAPMCLGVRGSRGATFALFDANPWIPPGTAVSVWGTVTGPSICGVPGIKVSAWAPNKKIKCRAA
jgi:hypothetical protein